MASSRRFVAAALRTLAACAVLAAAGVVEAAVAIGQPAPALVLRQVDDVTFDLAAQKGHVVVVNFWATWCPPCRAEMPVLEQFYRDHREQGVVLIGVSTDRPRDLRDVRRVMGAFSYPAGLLGAATVNGFGDPEALPVTYVIDAAGVVRGKLRADGTPVTRESLERLVAPLLSSPESARDP
jgi:cytochrome c biogenesis protein CcmG/thiol:disulfide interchange protein DsbE